jgi:Domain of unknown function (DUF4158)
MRYPGIAIGGNEILPQELIEYAASQLNISVDCWKKYGQREETRREHFLEILPILGLKQFTLSSYRSGVSMLGEIALQTDKAVVLAESLILFYRKQSVLIPLISVIERICAEAITQSNRCIYHKLTSGLTESNFKKLDGLLVKKEDEGSIVLTWLRQSPAAPNAKHLLEHIDRLTYKLI